jgi:hypothetical protein
MMRRATAASVMSLAVALAVACGGLGVSNGDGGAVEDGGVHSRESGTDATDGAVRGDVAADSFLDADTSPGDACLSGRVCGDAGEPPDGHFDGCAPYPCEAGQFCTNILVAGSDKEAFAFCQPISSTCESDPSCKCLEHEMECGEPACVEEAGEFSLTCVRMEGKP